MKRNSSAAASIRLAFVKEWQLAQSEKIFLNLFVAGNLVCLNYHEKVVKQHSSLLVMSAHY